MKRLIIEPKTEGKGRSFEALALAWVTADTLWPGGNNGNSIRPVWLMFAGSPEQLRAFSANLISGRKAQVLDLNSSRYEKHPPQMELLKSAGYALSSQRTSGSTVITAYLPDLFLIDPGMVDPAGIQFCLLPSQEWVDSQVWNVDRAVEHVSKLEYNCTEEALQILAPISGLFAVYLDRRTRCPLIKDERFYLQLLCACLDRGLASLSSEATYSTWGRTSSLGFKEFHTETVGLLPGIACRASHADMEQLLAEQAKLFFQLENTPISCKKVANG